MKSNHLAVWYAGTVLLIATSGMAAADEPALYDPPRIVQSTPLAQGSLTIDVLGIVPGMTPEQVEPLVRKSFGDLWFSKSKNAFTASKNSIWVRSSDYVSGLTGNKYDKDNQFDDHIYIKLSGVAGGNQTIGLSRQTCYGDRIERPFLVDVIKSFTDKYGGPSLASQGRLEWAYKDGAKIELLRNARLLPDFDQYDGNMLQYYPDADEATDYRLEVQFDLDPRDKTRIKCMQTKSGSVKLRREAAQADLKVLKEQLDQAVLSHPHVAGPDL